MSPDPTTRVTGVTVITAKQLRGPWWMHETRHALDQAADLIEARDKEIAALKARKVKLPARWRLSAENTSKTFYPSIDLCEEEEDDVDLGKWMKAADVLSMLRDGGISYE